MNTKIALGAAVAAAALFVTGCSNSTTADHSAHPSTSVQAAPSHDATAVYNDADVHFATMMYPHHAQAIDMAELVPDRSTNAEVITLASEIEDAQKPEMDQLAALLAQWGQPAPSMDMSGMDGMEHGQGGMMVPDDTGSLTSLSGQEFDRRWLTMMIEHHIGAVSMAEAEIVDGSNPDAIAMAQSIVDTQKAEIERMQQLLG
ncbi:DUF305 domain-containing protein [Rhodococcoides kyotonense]|uniref:DUF305 domain-containing protein n=1 Tax=Rhodococcoides kyotonense TaxID=398843 RepID=A0A177YHU7_9NOCA|nr:DUF305 domain-containing protein [Rhodococcus kyotonensis]OAK55001.1 DUF305 domain-containing protein [Rhodococcus kyotonensis]